MYRHVYVDREICIHLDETQDRKQSTVNVAFAEPGRVCVGVRVCVCVLGWYFVSLFVFVFLGWFAKEAELGLAGQCARRQTMLFLWLVFSVWCLGCVFVCFCGRFRGFFCCFQVFVYMVIACHVCVCMYTHVYTYIYMYIQKNNLL